MFDDFDLMVWVMILSGFYMFYECYGVVLLVEVFEKVKYMMLNVLGCMDYLRVVILWF